MIIKLKYFINPLPFALIIFFLFTQILNAAEEEKDCTYCLQFEILLDWPIDKRPSIFIYQEDSNVFNNFWYGHSVQHASLCQS